MMYRTGSFIAALLFCFTTVAFAVAESNPQGDQQIMDFSLAGFGEKGKKAWDLAGKSADISNDTIKLKNVVGNFYGQKEDVKLVSDKGDFNKQEALLHLEDNVVITTSTGAKLTTDSLDWDRKKKLVSTDEVVNIEKNNLTAVSSGATGNPDLNVMTLTKDVRVEVAQEAGALPSAAKDSIVITCDGPVQIDYAKNVAVFNKNVKVRKEDIKIDSDTMEVYFNNKKQEAEGIDAGLSASLMGGSIDKIISRGNVVITQGENISNSDEAIYDARNRKITLSGQPKLILYSGEGMDASLGN